MKYLIMKPYLLPIFALLIVGCGNSHARKIDSIIHDNNVVDSLRAFSFDTTQYNSSARIDKELTFLFKTWYNHPKYWDDYWLEELVDNRLRHHLNNPLTFMEDMPILDSVIRINSTADGKYKFYSYEIAGDGTAGAYRTYYQYRDAIGNIHIKEWQENIREGALIENIWQFNHAGQDYYVIKSFYKGQTCSWCYYMEIVTIDYGEIIYHTEFYPNGTFEPHNATYLIYNENGEIVDECRKQAYDIMVCCTNACNMNIDYSFDPETLTVHVKSDADTAESRTGAIKEYSWKLVLPPNNIHIKRNNR